MQLYFIPSFVAAISVARQTPCRDADYGPPTARRPSSSPRTTSWSIQNGRAVSSSTTAGRAVALKATDGVGEGNDDSSSLEGSASADGPSGGSESSPEFSPTSIFENMIHSITGDANYKFGDLSKNALSEITGKDLEKEAYQFGDISKSLVDRAGKALTGDDKYQFGDITKSKLQQLEKELDVWREDSLFALPNTFFQQTFKNLSPQQRRELILAIIRLGAIALLSWGLITNVLSAGLLSMAWTRTVLISQAAATSSTGAHLPLLPLNVAEPVWRTFLASHATLRLLLDPILLVMKGLGTLFIFQPYARFITTIERGWMPPGLRQRYPLLFRAFALVTAFTLNNVLIPTALASIGLGFGSSLARFFCYWFPLT